MKFPLCSIEYDLTTHWGLLELYWDNNCIIPITLTSIRSHSCLSSHTILLCGSSHCIKDLWITQGNCLTSVNYFRHYSIKSLSTQFIYKNYVFFMPETPSWCPGAGWFSIICLHYLFQRFSELEQIIKKVRSK